MPALASIGVASLVNMIAGLLRSKLLAVFLGPANVGITGIYASAFAVLAPIGSLGISTSVISTLPRASGAEARRRLLRRALMIAVATSTILCAALMLANDPVLRLLGLPPAMPIDGYLLVGTILSIAALMLTGVMQARHRVGSYAMTVGAGAIIATLIAAASVPWLRERAIGIAVICAPLGTVLAGSWLAWRGGREGDAGAEDQTPSPVTDAAEADGDLSRSMVRAGFWLMLAAMVQSAVPLMLRTAVARDLGLHDAGLFHVAWLLSTIAVTFLLQTMSADFLPKVSALAGDDGATSRLLARDVVVNACVGGIVLLGAAGFAWVAIPLLFSAEFAGAVGIFQLYCIGAMLQIASQNIAFAILPRRGGGAVLARDIAAGVVTITLALVLVRRFGLSGIGFAFIAGQAVSLLVSLTMLRLWRVARPPLAGLALSGGIVTLLIVIHQMTQGASIVAVVATATLMLILVRTADRAMLARVTARLPRIMKRKG